MQIRYQIPITNLKQSSNRIYVGAHWSKRKAFKDDVFSYSKAFCRPVQCITTYPVSIGYLFLFRKRGFDTTNCTYLVKCVEDSFRALGILKEDNPSCVARSCIEVVENYSTLPPEEIVFLGKKKVEANEDWLIITINPYGRKKKLERDSGKI